MRDGDSDDSGGSDTIYMADSGDDSDYFTPYKKFFHDKTSLIEEKRFDTSILDPVLWDFQREQRRPNLLQRIVETLNYGPPMFTPKMPSTEEKPDPIIFGDKSLSDLTLVVDNQEFITNKMVLANRSDVFNAMFYGNFKESKENRVEIKDVPVTNFRRLLEIIYTGKISDAYGVFQFPFKNENNEHVYLRYTKVKLREHFHKFWNDTTELLNIADRFNVTPIVMDYFESIIIPAMRICKDETCTQCLNTFIFAVLNGMDVSKCEKKYQMAHYKAWLEYADEKPFPDVPNKALKTLFQYFDQ